MDDPKQIVRDGYDKIASNYLREVDKVRVAERERYTRQIRESVPLHARLLDLGCGAGVPTTRSLAERYVVTGVDISEEQIRRARLNVPKAEFVRSDITVLRFEPCSFDAVTAFYSIIHVPRDEQPRLFRTIHRWLTPGGYFLGALGVHDAPTGIEPDWLGAPMYWSSFDADTNRTMVAASGLSIVSATQETADEGCPALLWGQKWENVPNVG